MSSDPIKDMAAVRKRHPGAACANCRHSDRRPIPNPHFWDGRDCQFCRRMQLTVDEEYVCRLWSAQIGGRPLRDPLAFDQQVGPAAGGFVLGVEPVHQGIELLKGIPTLFVEAPFPLTCHLGDRQEDAATLGVAPVEGLLMRGAAEAGEVVGGLEGDTTFGTDVFHASYNQPNACRCQQPDYPPWWSPKGPHGAPEGSETAKEKT